MCSLDSLVRRNISVHMETSNTEIDQLVESLGGYCYRNQVREYGLYQSFFFEKEANAKQFFMDVFRFPEVISVGFEKSL
jgi:hypothetical protein